MREFEPEQVRQLKAAAERDSRADRGGRRQAGSSATRPRRARVAGRTPFRQPHGLPPLRTEMLNSAELPVLTPGGCRFDACRGHSRKDCHRRGTPSRKRVGPGIAGCASGRECPLSSQRTVSAAPECDTRPSPCRRLLRVQGRFRPRAQSSRTSGSAKARRSWSSREGRASDSRTCGPPSTYSRTAASSSTSTSAEVARALRATQPASRLPARSRTSMPFSTGSSWNRSLSPDTRLLRTWSLSMRRLDPSVFVLSCS